MRIRTGSIEVFQFFALVEKFHRQEIDIRAGSDGCAVYRAFDGLDFFVRV
ncbi:MAG: hypothetical protein ACMVY4_21730 [Minwuia sp.]